MSKVVIIQRVVPHYRVQFFKKLHENLESLGIDFVLYYGLESPGTVPKGVLLSEPWTICLDNKYLNILGTELVWQKKCLFNLLDADLVIIEQANRLLANYVIICLGFLKKFKVAFWGHGKNLQADGEKKNNELLKNRMLRLVDWWFAYTALSVDIVEKCGFAESKITNVNNAIDTTIFKDQIQNIDNQHLIELKEQLGGEKARYCLYCGGMYALKKIDFLIAACVEIRKKIPDFNMIFIGGGPESYKVKKFSSEYVWVHYLGPQFGEIKTECFLLSEALLMPGAVGLSVVDSFIAETPVFTTMINTHGPEISYLKNSINGFIVKEDVYVYANAVLSYLQDSESQKKIHRGCQESAQLYTIDAMVENFTQGIVSCLGSS